MPELPEVETIRSGLHNRLANAKVVAVQGGGGRLVRKNPGGVADLREAFQGRRIESVNRRGKFMWITFQDAAPATLVVHLGMSGQVRYHVQPAAELGRHEHVRFTLEDGAAASFVDPRMFGHLTVDSLVQDTVGRQVPAGTLHIAPDLLEDVDLGELAYRFTRSRRAIKTMLLDQALTSGLGNIYADEALFRARIPGSAKGTELPHWEIVDLLQISAQVLADAVAQGGTSFDALYVDVDGNPGYFERELAVYGREGKPCKVCGAPIVREVLSGRSHFSCKNCQISQT